MTYFKGGTDPQEPMEMAIVRSRFNEDVTELLLKGATQVLDEKGVKYSVIEVPGVFELPMTAKLLGQSNRFDAVICLGAVIRGETGHYDFVATEAASGINHAGLSTEIPTIFGVLTTETHEQALVRADITKKNKGGESALAAIEMSNLLANLDDAGHISPFDMSDFFVDYEQTEVSS